MMGVSCCRVAAAAVVVVVVVIGVGVGWELVRVGSVRGFKSHGAQELVLVLEEELQLVRAREDDRGVAERGVRRGGRGGGG